MTDKTVKKKPEKLHKDLLLFLVNVSVMAVDLVSYLIEDKGSIVLHICV